ncbi:MAG: preprotein translocase subunit YajC [Paramuribaculum sp.]|nr:preprotein translocase subunit YajC [Paramuribaculum sp.]
MLHNSILLQVGGGNAGAMNLIMIVALIAVFYFFMTRPQQKRQKEIKKFRDGISTGDQVVTAGGIYGKVRKLKENVVSLEIANNVIINIDRGSIYPSAQDVQNDVQREADNK